MDCFQIEAESLLYLKEQSVSLNSIVDLVLKIIEIDEIMLSHLPECSPPYLDAFWMNASIKAQTRAERLSNLLHVASAYFRIQNNSSYIDIEFNKLIKRNSFVPSIIKLNNHLKALRNKIKVDKDLVQFRSQCLEIMSFLHSCKSESYYEIYCWKLKTCLILVGEILQKRPCSKSEFLQYLRLGKEVYNKKMVNARLMVSSYAAMLTYSAKNAISEKNRSYLAVEFQIIYHKYCRDLGSEPANLKKIFVTITDRQEKQDYYQYFEEEEREEKKKMYDLSERQNARKLKFARSLEYLTEKKQHFSSLHHKQKIFRSTGQDSNNSCTLIPNRNLNITPRKGLIMVRQSAKRKLATCMVNNSKSHMSNFKNPSFSRNNMYKGIISTDKKQLVLTSSKIEEETMIIEAITYEKPTPTFNEIMIGEDHSNKNEKDIVFSFKGISSESIIFPQSLKITVIQSFGREIVFFEIKVIKGSNENSVRFISEMNKFNEEIILNSQTVFSFEDLRKEVGTSQFYFELIQEYVEKNLQINDCWTITNYFGDDRLQKTAYIIICINRLSRSLIYWYYTKAVKINGSIFTKRQIPPMSDPLKFSIALDFMKKYDNKACLQKLGNARNKKAIFECFRYLFYGRNLIAKGLLQWKSKIAFFTLSLQKFNEANFSIKKQGSYFKDVEFKLSIYNLQDFQILHSQQFNMTSLLSQHRITLNLLRNIIDNEQYRADLTTILSSIQGSQRKQPYSFPHHSTSEYKVNIVINVDNEQNKSIKELCNCHNAIKNYLHLILWYIELCGGLFNLKVIKQVKKVKKIQNSYLKSVEIHIGCGLIVEIFEVNFRKCVSKYVHIRESEGKQREYVLQRTPFYSRMGIKLEDGTLLINKIKRRVIQACSMYTLRVILKIVLKIGRKFYYFCLSWEISIHCWRIDIYEPIKSRRFTTYFSIEGAQQQNEEKNIKEHLIYLEHMIGFHQKSIKISEDLRSIRLGSLQLSLFQSFNSLQAQNGRRQAKLELVEMNNQLHLFIIVSGESNLFICEVDDSPFINNVNMFADCPAKNHIINLYNDLFVRLYIKFINSSLPMLEIRRIQQIHE